jgi:hypothetical protein
MVRLASPTRAAIRPGRLRQAGAACLLVCVGAMAASGARAVTEVRPPRLTHTVSTLPNGLTLILHEDHSAPIVNVRCGTTSGRRTNGRGAGVLRTSSST